MNTVVAICGRSGAGKDAGAARLVGMGFTSMKFAAPLKDAVSTLFGLTAEQVHGATRDVVDPRHGRTPREILQFVGTEMFQHKLQELCPGCGRRFWADNLCDRLRSHVGDVVITDMRFQHELDALMELDPAAYRVVALRVRRPGQPRSGRVAAHASETELERIDCAEVLNDGTLDELNAAVARAAGAGI